VRITGGEFGGRTILVPKSDEIRPTQDRVRAALFNIIQFEVPGCDFLDLFSGSGAVGLEALSRGAKSVTFVEQNRRHVAVLQKNLSSLTPNSPTSQLPNLPTSQLPNLPTSQLPNFPTSQLPNFPTSIRTFEHSNISLTDAYRYIETYVGEGFSIAFADPPYALGEEKGYAHVLATLAARGVVRPNGLFIAEMTAVQKAEETPGWELVRDRTYGKTRLCIWRRMQNDETPAV